MPLSADSLQGQGRDAGEGLRIAFNEECLTISLGGNEWRTCTKDFEARSAGVVSLVVAGGNDPHVFRISLRNANFPGTDLHADFDCDLELQTGHTAAATPRIWVMRFGFLSLADASVFNRRGAILAAVDFGRWLQNSACAESPEIRFDTTAIRFMDQPCIALRGSATVRLYPRWKPPVTDQDHAPTDQVGVLLTSTGTIADLYVRRLSTYASQARIVIRTGNAESLIEHPAVHRTIFELTGGTVGQIPPRLSPSSVWCINPVRDPFEIVCVESHAADAASDLTAHAPGHRRRIALRACASRQWTGGSLKYFPGGGLQGQEGPFYVRLCGPTYLLALDPEGDEAALTANVDATTDKPLWLSMVSCSFSLANIEDYKPVPNPDPAAPKDTPCPFVMVSIGPRLERFRLIMNLTGVVPSFADATVNVDKPSEPTPLKFIYGITGDEGPALNELRIYPRDLLISRIDTPSSATLHPKPGSSIRVAMPSFTVTRWKDLLNLRYEFPVTDPSDSTKTISNFDLITHDRPEEPCCEGTPISYQRSKDQTTDANPHLYRRPGLIHAGPGEGRLRIHFPPQHVQEQALFRDESGIHFVPPPVQSALAGESQLEFVITDKVREVKLEELGDLLDWVDLPLKQPNQFWNVSTKHVPDDGSFIEAPFGIALIPDAPALFRNSKALVTTNGRTELWHTRMERAGAAREYGGNATAFNLPGPSTASEGGTANVVQVRSVLGTGVRQRWVSTFQGSARTEAFRPLSVNNVDVQAEVTLDFNDRFNIIGNTGAFNTNQANLGIPRTQDVGPIAAEQLILSPLGAWLNLEYRHDLNPHPNIPSDPKAIPTALEIRRFNSLIEIALRRLNFGGADPATFAKGDPRRQAALAELFDRIESRDPAALAKVGLFDLIDTSKARPTTQQSIIADQRLEEWRRFHDHLEKLKKNPQPAVPPANPAEVELWQHRSAMGRDYYVRVITGGLLYPYGHRASLVAVGNREIQPSFDSDPKIAYVIKQYFIVVREPVRNYDHSEFSFKSVRIVTTSTPLLDRPFETIPGQVPNTTKPGEFEPLPNDNSQSAFWPMVLGNDFRFLLQGTDHEGKIHEFKAPMIFAERAIGSNFPVIAGGFDALRIAYNTTGLNSGPLQDSRRNLDLRNQRIHFAPAVLTAENNSSLETSRIIFKAISVPRKPDASFDAEEVTAPVALLQQLIATTGDNLSELRGIVHKALPLSGQVTGTAFAVRQVLNGTADANTINALPGLNPSIAAAMNDLLRVDKLSWETSKFDNAVAWAQSEMKSLTAETRTRLKAASDRLDEFRLKVDTAVQQLQQTSESLTGESGTVQNAINELQKAVTKEIEARDKDLNAAREVAKAAIGKINKEQQAVIDEKNKIITTAEAAIQDATSKIKELSAKEKLTDQERDALKKAIESQTGVEKLRHDAAEAAATAAATISKAIATTQQSLEKTIIDRGAQFDTAVADLHLKLEQGQIDLGRFQGQLKSAQSDLSKSAENAADSVIRAGRRLLIEALFPDAIRRLDLHVPAVESALTKISAVAQMVGSQAAATVAAANDLIKNVKEEVGKLQKPIEDKAAAFFKGTNIGKYVDDNIATYREKLRAGADTARGYLTDLTKEVDVASQDFVRNSLGVAFDKFVPLDGIRAGTNIAALGLSKINYFKEYVDNRFDAARNAGAVFAEIAKDFPTQAAKFAKDKFSGMISPDMDVTGLSNKIGAVAGDLKDLANAAFNPLQYFAGAKILGLLDLKDILQAAIGLEKIPKLVSLPKFPVINGVPDLTKPPEFVEASFTWTPTTKAFLFFKPLGDPNKTLTMKCLVRTQTRTGDTFHSIDSVLTDFAVDVFGCVRVTFKSLRFLSESGKALKVTPDVDKVDFLGPLAFAAKLQEMLGSLFGNGFAIDIMPTFIRPSMDFQIPDISMGIFSLSNVHIGASLELPLAARPVKVRFNFAERKNPFILQVAIFGGGGFFAVKMQTALTLGGAIEQIEGALEFGGYFALNIVVASGKVYLLAGIYFSFEHYTRPGSEESEPRAILSGYVRAGGSLSVLGIITVSVEFRLELTYDSLDGSVVGRATLTVHVEILFFEADVDLTLEKRFAGSPPPSNQPINAAVFPGLLEDASSLGGRLCDEMSLHDWRDYLDAFAPA